MRSRCVSLLLLFTVANTTGGRVACQHFAPKLFVYVYLTSGDQCVYAGYTPTGESTMTATAFNRHAATYTSNELGMPVRCACGYKATDAFDHQMHAAAAAARRKTNRNREYESH